MAAKKRETAKANLGSQFSYTHSCMVKDRTKTNSYDLSRNTYGKLFFLICKCAKYASMKQYIYDSRTRRFPLFYRYFQQLTFQTMLHRWHKNYWNGIQTKIAHDRLLHYQGVNTIYTFVSPHYVFAFNEEKL